MDYIGSLIGMLPFDWAQTAFMKNALVAVLLLSPLFGLISTMVVSNKVSFFSDALGHSAFTGIVIGALLGMVTPIWCAILFALFFSVLFSVIKMRSTLSSDTIIGVFSATAVSLGIFLATLNGGSFTKFNSYLIGDILSVSRDEITMLFILLIAVILIWCLFINRFALTATFSTLAKSRGVNADMCNMIFSALIAMAVTLCMQWVGLLVINSFIMLPAAASRCVSKNMKGYHAVSVIGSIICGISGLMIAYYLGSSAGACISLCLAVFFIVCYVVGKIRKTI